MTSSPASNLIQSTGSNHAQHIDTLQEQHSKPSAFNEFIDSFFDIISGKKTRHQNLSEVELNCPRCQITMKWAGYIRVDSGTKLLWTCQCGFKMSTVE